MLPAIVGTPALTGAKCSGKGKFAGNCCGPRAPKHLAGLSDIEAHKRGHDGKLIQMHMGGGMRQARCISSQTEK